MDARGPELPGEDPSTPSAGEMRAVKLELIWLTATVLGLFLLAGLAYLVHRWFPAAPFWIGVGLVLLDFVPLYFFFRYMIVETTMQRTRERDKRV